MARRYLSRAEPDEEQPIIGGWPDEVAPEPPVPETMDWAMELALSKPHEYHYISPDGGCVDIDISPEALRRNKLTYAAYLREREADAVFRARQARRETQAAQDQAKREAAQAKAELAAEKEAFYRKRQAQVDHENAMDAWEMQQRHPEALVNSPYPIAYPPDES